MKKVIISSKNPVKITSVKLGFQRMFPDIMFDFIGISVPSNVSDQPKSNLESFTGALNRANNASIEDADYYVGLEGGITDNGKEMNSIAWAVIKSGNTIGKASAATFVIPEKVAELIRQGKELGEADDIVFGKENSKQANGSVGLLTHNSMDRTEYYTQAIILALVPFKNPDLY